MHAAAAGANQGGERVNVGGLQFGELTVFENEARHFMLFGEALEHIDSRRYFFALAVFHWTGRPSLLKRTSPSCLGELMLNSNEQRS